MCLMEHNPLYPGQSLYVTKIHAPKHLESDEEDLKAAIVTAKRVANALRSAVKPDGLNMLQANGAAAFQSVPHFHLHLIPRWTNDGKGFDWKQVAGDRAQLMKVGEKVRSALSGGTA